MGRKILLSTNPSTSLNILCKLQRSIISYVSAKFKTKGFLIDSIIAVPDLSHDLVIKVVDENDSMRRTKLYKTGSRFTFA